MPLNQILLKCQHLEKILNEYIFNVKIESSCARAQQYVITSIRINSIIE